MKSVIFDYLKMPEKHIPYGLYCYHNNYICPFWESRPGEYPKQEDGYCYFLGKSDWDLNKKYKDTTKVVYSKDKKIINKSVSELFGCDDIDPVSGKQTHFIMSLLWDQCKECGINGEDPDDIELVTVTVEIENNNHIQILNSKKKK